MTSRRIVTHELGTPAHPTLVLLHGLTEAGTAWPDAVRRWSGRWLVVAPDQRGHGLSPRFRPEETVRAMDVLVDDALELLDRSDRPILVGHSLGGRVAVGAALRAPEKIAALVLEDPALTEWDRAPAGFVREQERFLDSYAVDAGAARRAELRVASSWSEEEIVACAECKPHVDRAFVHDLHMGGIDPVAALDALDVPTLLVLPRDSQLVPDPGRITNPLVRVETVEDAGHCVRRDNAPGYHRVVDPFLEEHRAACGSPASRGT